MNYLEIIPSAFAQQSAAAEGSSVFSMFLPMLVVFAIFYFLIIRPQKSRDKAHQNFVASLQKGDEVVTQSGLLGKITGVADKVITLEVAPSVKIKVLKGTVLQKVDQNLASPSN